MGRGDGSADEDVGPNQFQGFKGKDPILTPVGFSRNGGSIVAPEALMEQCRDPLPLSEVFAHSPTEPFPCSILEANSMGQSDDNLSISAERYSDFYNSSVHGMHHHQQSAIFDLHSDPPLQQSQTFSFYSL